MPQPHDDPHEIPIRAVTVLDTAGHEPALLLAPRRDAGGATVEVDVDGRGVRVLLSDLIDAVAGAAADTGVGVLA